MTEKMSVVEALMVQRDAVMFGWNRLPTKPNTACAVVRRGPAGEFMYLHVDNMRAATLLHGEARRRSSQNAIGFNHCPSTTLDDMLDLFDEAIRRAKELEDSQ